MRARSSQAFPVLPPIEAEIETLTREHPVPERFLYSKQFPLRI
jgi:hypothetical protein